MKFDTVIKNLIDGVKKHLAEIILGEKINEIYEIDKEIKIVKQIRADFLAIVRTEKRGKFILHLEFQAQNKEITYRNFEIYAILHAKFKLPIEQYIIWIGRRKCRIKNKIKISTGSTNLIYQNHRYWENPGSFIFQIKQT